MKLRRIETSRTCARRIFSMMCVYGVLVDKLMYLNSMKSDLWWLTRDSSVSVVTKGWAVRDSLFDTGKILFSSSELSDWPRGPPSVLFGGYHLFFPKGWSDLSMKLTTYLRLVSTVRTTGTIPFFSLYAFLARTGTTLHFVNSVTCRSQWPSCLRQGSAADRLLGLRVRIPPVAWMSVVSVVFCQVEFSATGRSLI
jgi:hypothetical protein